MLNQIKKHELEKEKAVIDGELHIQPAYSVNSRFFGKNKKLPLTKYGKFIIVRRGASIYAGVQIGNYCFIGDNASIRENVTIGDHCIIGRNVTIEPNTWIGNEVVVQTGAHLTGDMIIEDGCFIGPEVCTMNDKYMGLIDIEMKGPWIMKGASIGGNATLLPGIKVGRGAIVGAGSVVTKDVKANEIVVGNPAKFIGFAERITKK